MRIYYFLLFLFAISLMPSCKPSNLLPTEYKGDQLHFGQGGGFTGAVTYFVLLDDSRLFEKNTLDSTYTFRSEWDKDFTKQMFHNYESLGLSSLEYYHPGNLYYFIEHHSTGKKTHRISWGKSDMTPPENIVNFYNLLFKSTKSKS